MKPLQIGVACSMFALLSSCDRKEGSAEKPPPPREARAPLPRSAASGPAADPADLAADALATAIGPDAVFKAAAALADTGSPQAVELLVEEATTRRDETEVTAIFDSFQHLTRPEALNTLAELAVRGKSPAVLKAANAVLSDRADATTVEVLTGLLYDRPAPVDRSHKVRLILQSISNPPAERPLARLLLTAPEPGVIESAATALGNIASPTARTALQQALDDRPDLPPQLRQSIQKSLAKIPAAAGEGKSAE